MSAGFYTSDLRYAPNAVYGPGFSLLKEDKDTYVYPVQGWTWFNNRDEAVAASNSTPEQLEAARVALVIQDLLDSTARGYGFDSILSAVSYLNDRNPEFSSNARKLFDWRSRVWTTAAQIKTKILSGEIQQPTDEEFLAMLPSIN